MPKGYWVSAHRRSPDPEKSAAYRDLAIPALKAAGGKFLAAGGQVESRESGLDFRVALIEFPTYEAAVAAYESEAYQAALAALGDGAERDFRIIEGND